jgi:hypothetical protein
VGGQTVLDFRYTLKLALTMGAQNVNVSMDGTFSVTDKNSPVALTINANVNGSAQKAAYTVEGKTINLSANAGGQDIKRSAQLSGTEALSVNNLMTLMSLATRTLNIGPGQSVKASLFSAEALRSIEITFAAQPKTEQVTIAGKQIDCVVCDISAIASRVYLDKATGEMVKYVMASQGLEVTRQ